MNIDITVNGEMMTLDVAPSDTLLEVLRKEGFHSIKQGCDTSNCGLCTVWVDDIPILSCSYIAMRAEGKNITTLEGLKKEALEFGSFLATEGGDQCGFCSPGLIMNVISLKRKFKNPTEEMIQNYLMGNLCRCTGYSAQLRAIKKYCETNDHDKF